MQQQSAAFGALPAPSPDAVLAAYYSRLRTPVGAIGIHWQDRVVTVIDLVARSDLSETPAPDWLAAEICAYFDDPEHVPTVATAPAGTLFQRSVWQTIAAIPCGATRTYRDIAEQLGSAPRAVGGACRANPYPLVVPCHRVVGVRGLGGFAGDLDGRLVGIKRWLLAHEGARGIG